MFEQLPALCQLAVNMSRPVSRGQHALINLSGSTVSSSRTTSRTYLPIPHRESSSSRSSLHLPHSLSVAAQSPEAELLKEEAAELADLFRLVDKDGGGTISMDEFLELLQSMSVRPSIHEMQLLYDEIDENGNGAIEMDEFMNFMDDSRIGNKVSRDDVIAAFAMFEGYADGESLREECVRREDVIAAVMEYASDHIHVGRTERTTVTEDRRERSAGGGLPARKNDASRAATATSSSNRAVVSDDEKRRVVHGLLNGLPWDRDGYLDYRQFVVDNTKERTVVTTDEL